ncbi:unnamed protein product [Linum tenue]|uniref:BED-type domain-containing protein n=1 Tax=Linum tenue TaxID=586396 RepID=A0AAV0L8V3_9ROSI|nr:unnamed protein product [Linum tenue]
MQAAAANLQNANASNGNVVEELLDFGKLKSVVWLHYSKVLINGIVKAKCNYCKKQLAGESNNGTTHLKKTPKSVFKRKLGMVVKRFLALTIWLKESTTWLLVLSTLIFQKRSLQLLLQFMNILCRRLIIPNSRDLSALFKLCSLYHQGILSIRSSLRFMILNELRFKVCLISIEVE